MRAFKIFLTVVLIITFSVNSYSQQSKPTVHKVEVAEVLQVSSYTYLRVKENNDEIWLAVPTIIANKGDIYFYKGGMEMPNFESKELNRTFKSVIFLGAISKNPTGKDNVSFEHTKVKKEKGIDLDNELPINIKPIEGGVTISELFKNKKRYQGKRVKIRGKVIKFNSQVMSKNWIHLQDGTDNNDNFDITITSNAYVNVGDIVTLEGLVSLDKDFGYGYFYKLIIENAVLID
ncbi:hypothetical protein [Lutibacter sp.]|uniref:hypothetical protein n=1 Tax=Lutibacter sp. TaxID=1925666 RepID=UPI0025C3E5F3|nr:hypothetical protein [Lutibacter sp.]MCF6169318.1 hypothetical protein [Lutibacter sp.]